MLAEIRIFNDFGDSLALLEELNRQRLDPSEYTLRCESDHSRYRSPDSTTLVALVGLAGTGLGALINGLLNVAAQKHSAHVEISGENWSIKVPVSMSVIERDQLIEKAKSQSVKSIRIAGD